MAKGSFNGISNLTSIDMHEPTFGAGEAMGLFAGAADGISGPSVTAKAESSVDFGMVQPS